MNNALSRIALALALFGVAACSKPAPEQPPLAGAKLGGDFALIDQDGRRFDSKALRGRYVVTYFGYTFCPDVCPTDMQKLGAGLRKFESMDAARAAKVQPVFITVDPARDTPAVVKEFVANFHPRIIGLTGTEDEIREVARLYAAPFSKEPQAPGTQGYLMQHASTAILFDPDGKPLALVPVDTDADQVAATFAKWVS